MGRGGQAKPSNGSGLGTVVARFWFRLWGPEMRLQASGLAAEVSCLVLVRKFRARMQGDFTRQCRTGVEVDFKAIFW